MEEQPKVRAQERRYHPHGEERSPIQLKTSIKNEQIHIQHQETQTKKTGNGKINPSDVEGERIQSADHTAGTPHATTNNGNRHLTNANARQKSTQKVYSSAPPASGLVQIKTMTSDDKARALDVHHCEGQESGNNDSASLQNGEVNSVYITNGFSGDPTPDHAGSGSEGGYTTPKRRRGGRNSIKNCENVTRDGNRDMQHGCASAESEASSPEASDPGAGPSPEASDPGAGPSPEASDPGAGPRPYGTKSAHKVDHTLPRRTVAPEDVRGDLQRKDSDSKTAGASGKKFEDRTKAKLSSSTKEDSWTLFKPPPVFPVDNSSAKIVPKISYASKVKENLNKPAQAGGELLAPQAPVRLSQVPMSAMKTITSASFTNGPISGDGNGIPSGGTFFASAASSIPPAHSLPCGEKVASSSDSNCSSSINPAAAFETRKCTLFIPLNPLNMQPVLPSARQVDNRASQTHQKALGEIFHNQWGLSFINEPNIGADGGGGEQRGEGKTVPVTFQGECTVAADQPCPYASSPSPEPASVTLDLDRRTSTPGGVSAALGPAPGARDEGASLHHAGLEKSKGEAKSPGALLAASCKHAAAAETVQSSLTTLVSGLSKEQARPRSLDRRCSWGSFDLKAAVNYHTKEMGCILNLQKQDPNRVVIYDEPQRAPDQ
ncbi:FMR1-interacting protein NUFIP2 isoform X2 [Osmerus eperlanus]|uniref:FMR1-interacting protein NUFIP2 isoform X2 n=1 Tax=Osmerus eperlanus TaxID=29151 RepID=UPI002E156055